MGDTKGREYARSAVSRFSNFDRLSTLLDIPNTQICLIYLMKHIDGIAYYVKNGNEASAEPIRGRIIDAITYLTLLAGMIEEAAPNFKINHEVRG